MNNTGSGRETSVVKWGQKERSRHEVTGGLQHASICTLYSKSGMHPPFAYTPFEVERVLSAILGCDVHCMRGLQNTWLRARPRCPLQQSFAPTFRRASRSNRLKFQAPPPNNSFRCRPTKPHEPRPSRPFRTPKSTGLRSADVISPRRECLHSWQCALNSQLRAFALAAAPRSP